MTTLQFPGILTTPQIPHQWEKIAFGVRDETAYVTEISRFQNMVKFRFIEKSIEMEQRNKINFNLKWFYKKT